MGRQSSHWGAGTTERALEARSTARAFWCASSGVSANPMWLANPASCLTKGSDPVIGAWIVGDDAAGDATGDAACELAREEAEEAEK